MKKIAPILPLACLALLSQAALSQSNLNTQLLASNCANCHGTQGNAAAGSAVPGLAGYSKEAFIATMNAFKKGERQATIMHQISKGYSDEQIATLAAYFAAQKK